jgi:hypothetical protein
LSVVPRDWQVGVEGAFSVVTHVQNVIIIACKGRDLVVFNTGREGTTTPTPNSVNDVKSKADSPPLLFHNPA